MVLSSSQTDYFPRLDLEPNSEPAIPADICCILDLHVAMG